MLVPQVAVVSFKKLIVEIVPAPELYKACISQGVNARFQIPKSSKLPEKSLLEDGSFPIK